MTKKYFKDISFEIGTRIERIVVVDSGSDEMDLITD